MELNDEIKLKEMQHAHWLCKANHFSNIEIHSEHLYDDAISRSEYLIGEIEELYRYKSMGQPARLAYLIEKAGETPIAKEFKRAQEVMEELSNVILTCTHSFIKGIPCGNCFSATYNDAEKRLGDKDEQA